jgi:hypothetical protein
MRLPSVGFCKIFSLEGGEKPGRFDLRLRTATISLMLRLGLMDFVVHVKAAPACPAGADHTCNGRSLPGPAQQSVRLGRYSAALSYTSPPRDSRSMPRTPVPTARAASFAAARSGKGDQAIRATSLISDVKCITLQAERTVRRIATSKSLRKSENNDFICNRCV